MSSVVENSLQPVPLVATALTAMAVGVVFLAAVGIYGLLSRLAQQHTREMGIRIALGGSRAAIYWLVLGYGIRPALAGVSVGGVLSVLVFTAIVRAGAAAAGDSGAVPSLVSMAGPPLMVVGVLLVVVLAACHGPAWRVTRVDPAVSLRHV
jgi:ABC-type antimicrobial peptide transport system permease subunit